MEKLIGKKKIAAIVGLSLVAMTFASCGGSDNKSAPVAQNTSGTSSATATVQGTSSCQTSSSFADFKKRVANMNFVKNSSIRETYYYYDCQEKSGWFGLKYNGCDGNKMKRSINTDTGFIRHESGNSIEAVRDYLSSLVNNAVDARGGASYYEVKTSSGDWYKIDLCQPIVSNPVKWLRSDEGESYSYYGRSSY